MKNLKRSLIFISALALAATMPACSSKNSESSSGSSTPSNSDSSSSESKAQADGPLTPYADEITVTLGRETIQNPKLPDGDTYEDNAYTRWLKKALNIKIKDAFEANGDDYSTQVSLALSSGEMPDMMKVSSKDVLRELYENDMIADLTDAYNTYASDYIKQVYDSYDGRALGDVTFDGKIMAIPATNVDTVGEVWIRSDWVQKLGMKIDEDKNGCITISELEGIAKEFMQKNPGNAQSVVGMAFAPWLTAGEPDGTYSINTIAYALGAFPKTWMNVDGKVVYGSTTPETKTALKQVAAWFKNGLVDQQLGTRTWDDITALLINGQTGITFGCWHIPDWLLNNVRSMDNKATFEAYAIEDANGKVNCKHNNATAGYFVVSKKYAHPEAAIKIVNLFYDEMTNSKTLKQDYPDVAKYQQDGVDGSTRPFNIEINKSTSLLDDYSDIEKGVNGEISPEQARTIESRTVIQNVKNYLANPEGCEVVDWSKYHSRMKGIELIQNLTENNKLNWVTPIFPTTTQTMKTNWANLQKMEEETFIKIATGAEDADTAFDQFVKDWNSMGGEQIISEIEEQLK